MKMIQKCRKTTSIKTIEFSGGAHTHCCSVVSSRPPDELNSCFLLYKKRQKFNYRYKVIIPIREVVSSAIYLIIIVEPKFVPALSSYTFKNSKVTAWGRTATERIKVNCTLKIERK